MTNLSIEDQNQRSGSPYHRGSADAYYQRGFNPHYYTGAVQKSLRVSRKDMTPAEVAEYREGYDAQVASGEKKDYGTVDILCIGLMDERDREFFAPYGAKILRGVAVPKKFTLNMKAAALLAAHNSDTPSIINAVKKRRESSSPDSPEIYDMPDGNVVLVMPNNFGALCGPIDDVMADWGTVR